MYIKAKYLKNDIPAGKAYTFETDVPVKIGDKVSIGKAQAIVEYREKNGAFTQIEQLEEVKGIGAALIARNRDRLKL